MGCSAIIVPSLHSRSEAPSKPGGPLGGLLHDAESFLQYFQLLGKVDMSPSATMFSYDPGSWNIVRKLCPGVTHGVPTQAVVRDFNRVDVDEVFSRIFDATEIA